MKGRLFVISGPSGAGKTTVVSHVIKERADAVENISHTTRAMRAGEVNGVDYHFRAKKDFLADIEQGKFIESFQVFDNYYGTAQADIDNLLTAGKHVVMILDYQGALELKRIFGKALTTVFILTANEKELETRLRDRNTDDDDTISKRLSNAKHEISQSDKFDNIIVNTEISRAVNALNNIIDSHR